MILLEYEAKGLLNDFGVPVEMGELYRENPSGTSSQENYLPKKFPVVIKSQVPVGGRGKLGGVKIAHNHQEFTQFVTEIQQTSIKGYLPTNLYSMKQSLLYHNISLHKYPDLLHCLCLQLLYLSRNYYTLIR